MGVRYIHTHCQSDSGAFSNKPAAMLQENTKIVGWSFGAYVACHRVASWLFGRHA